VGVYILTAAICFAGGLIAGATGFGALLIMIPLLFLYLDMSTAIPVGVLCSFFIQAQGAIIYRSHIQTTFLIPLIVSSLPGVWLGSLLLKYTPEIWLRAVLGLFFASYAIWSFCSKTEAATRPPAMIWAYIAGFFSGILGGAFGTSGPPALIYGTRTGWSPSAMKGTLNTLFALLLTIIILVYFFHGFYVEKVLLLAAISVPACFFGGQIGRHLTSKLPPGQYLKLIFLFILAMSLPMCWPAAKLLIFG